MTTKKTALQFADLRDINDVDPLTPQDERCLTEIAEVLKRHGAEARFGLTLLHTHFNVLEDEVLVEHLDSDARTLTIRPVAARELKSIRLMETNWRFDDPTQQHRCILFCKPSGGGSHSGHQQHR